MDNRYKYKLNDKAYGSNLHRKFFDKSQNIFKNNILSDSLPTKYTLQSHLKNLYMYCVASATLVLNI